MISIDDFVQMSPDERRKLINKYDLVDITEEMIRTSDNNQTGPGTIRASMLGSDAGSIDNYAAGCPRALWYYYFDYPQAEQETDSKQRTALGTALHLALDRFYQQAEKRYGPIQKVELEKEMHDDRGTYVLTGHSDLVITFPEMVMTVDFKTIGWSSFQSLNSPKNGHVSQDHVYMKYFDSPVGAILYLTLPDMNTWAFKSFQFGWSQKRWNALEQRLEQVEQHIIAQEPPPAEGSYKYCTEWCPYRHICDKGGGACLVKSNLIHVRESKQLKNWWKK